MTTIEALNEITSEHKWYVGKIKQYNASKLHRRIRLGKCKPITVKKFMNIFGYYGSSDCWGRLEEIEPNEWIVTNAITGKRVHINTLQRGGNHLIFNLEP